MVIEISKESGEILIDVFINNSKEVFIHGKDNNDNKVYDVLVTLVGNYKVVLTVDFEPVVKIVLPEVID